MAEQNQVGVAQLIGRIEVAQDRAHGGLPPVARKAVLNGLLGALALLRIGDRIGGPALLVQVGDDGFHRGVRDAERVDLRLGVVRQRAVPHRMQLPIEEFVGAERGEFLGARRARAPGDAVEQIEVPRAEHRDVGLARLRACR